MDSCVEQLFERKASLGERLAVAGSVLLIVAGLVIAMFVKANPGLTLVIIGIVCVYFTKNALHQELEYELANGDCYISKIINKSDRKDLYSFYAGDVMRVLAYDSEKFTNELQVNQKLVVKDMTSGHKENHDRWYAFMLAKDVAVILELDDRSLEHIKTVYKHKFE